MARRIVAGWLFLAVVVGACGMAPGLGDVPPGQTCVEVPQPLCDQQARQAIDSVGPGAGRVVGVLVRCTRPPCTATSGEGESIVEVEGGRQVGYGWAVAEAAPAPGGKPLAPTPLPVEPVCLGIPREACLEYAITDPSDGAGPPIVSIVVRCTAACDLRRGEGKTTFTHADGSTSQSDWTYESG